MDRYLRNLVQIDEAERELVRDFGPRVRRSTLPATTAGGRSVTSLRIGDPGADIAVLFVGGVHARELAPPSALLHLARALLVARAGTTGITLGGYSASAQDVQRIVSRCDLHILPMANPDGRHYNLTVDANWRKSRFPRNCAQDDKSGTDINRNFPIAWDFRLFYDATGERDVGSSDNPCHYELYIGPTGPRQAETQNVMSLIDSLPLRWYVDVHSFGPKIYFPWGMDTDGTDPAMRWNNPVWDNRRDGTAGAAYSEFISAASLAEHQMVAGLMVNAIDRAASSTTPTYRIIQSALDGATTGASDDYAFSRNTIDPSRNTVVFTFESGSRAEGGFRPNLTQYLKIERDIMAGLLALLVHASNAPLSGSGASTGSGSTGTGSGTGSGPGSSTPPRRSWCFLFNSLYGSAHDPDIEHLRRFRDRVLAPSRAGRVAIAAYYRMSPGAVRALANRPRTRRFLRDRVVRPAVRRATRDREPGAGR